MNPTIYLGEFPDSRPRIFAHRGLVYEGDGQVVDENTIDSFELALAAGADYLETDLQLTKDGVAVLFHDSDLSRLVGSKKSISSLTHSELKQIRLPFGGHERVLVSSFSESSRVRALAHSPVPITSSAGSSKVLTSYTLARLNLSNKLAASLADVQALQIPTRMYGIDFTHPRFVEAVLKQNKEIHYWTVNDPSEMLSLFALGAHGIVTDRSDIAIKVFS